MASVHVIGSGLTPWNFAHITRVEAQTLVHFSWGICFEDACLTKVIIAQRCTCVLIMLMVSIRIAAYETSRPSFGEFRSFFPGKVGSK